MRKLNLITTFGVIAAMAMFATVASAQMKDNPRIGKWQIQSDAPPPARNIMTYEPYGDGGMRVTVEATNAKGETRKWGYVTMFDGKFRPVTGDSSTEESAVEVIDERTTKISNKRGDQVNVIINVISEDGNTINNEYRRTDENGKEVVSHAVYKRIQ